MKKLILILILLIPIISYSQVYVRSAETMYFDEGWVNLAQYFANGVIPQGTDITDELQEALTSGKHVIIPPIMDAPYYGNYFISANLRMTKSGQIIQGAGNGNTFLRAVSGCDTMLIISVGSVTVRDLAFVGDGTTTKYGIYINNSANWSYFENLYLTGFKTTTSDTAYALYVNYAFSHSFNHCRFYENEGGIYGYILNATDFTGCQAVENSIVGYYLKSSYYVTIQGGTCEVAGGDADNLYIFDNSYVTLSGVYSESARRDIFVRNDAVINMYGGQIGKVELDSSSGIIIFNLFGTNIDSGTDTVLGINFHKLGSPLSQVNLYGCRWLSSGYGGGNHLNIINYTSDMYVGKVDNMIDYLLTYPNVFNGKVVIDTLIQVK